VQVPFRAVLDIHLNRCIRTYQQCLFNISIDNLNKRALSAQSARVFSSVKLGTAVL
jgi:hypothetical protein